MTISVDWYGKDKNHIRYKIVGQWSWEDLHVAIDEAIQLLDSADDKVHLILDMRETSHVPTLAVKEMGKVANAPTMTHPNTDKLLMVGQINISKSCSVSLRKYFQMLVTATSYFRPLKH